LLNKVKDVFALDAPMPIDYVQQPGEIWNPEFKAGTADSTSAGVSRPWNLGSNYKQ
jgi:hypothetical protein